MQTDDKTDSIDLDSASNEQLRHEIKYLRERLNNLEAFKRLFFDLKNKESSGDDSQENTSTSLIISALSDFIHESCKVASYQDLVMLIFQELSAYNINPCIQLHCLEGDLTYSHNSNHHENNLKLINRLKKNEGMSLENDLICINHEHLSFLAQDMPVNNESEYEKIKQHLNVLCEATDARIAAMDDTQNSNEQISHLFEIIDNTQSDLNELEKDVDSKLGQTDRVRNKLIDKVVPTISKLKLNKSQQNAVTTLINACLVKQGETLVNSLSINEKLNTLIKELELSHNEEKPASHPGPKYH